MFYHNNYSLISFATVAFQMLTASSPGRVDAGLTRQHPQNTTYKPQFIIMYTKKIRPS